MLLEQTARSELSSRNREEKTQDFFPVGAGDQMELGRSAGDC